MGAHPTARSVSTNLARFVYFAVWEVSGDAGSAQATVKANAGDQPFQANSKAPRDHQGCEADESHGREATQQGELPPDRPSNVVQVASLLLCYSRSSSSLPHSACRIAPIKCAPSNARTLLCL